MMSGRFNYPSYGEKLAKLLERISILGMFLMVLIIVSQIFMRYVLQFSLSWSDEVARIMNIWIVFLAAYIVLMRNEHVKVDYFMSFLPLELNFKLDIFINFMCGFFCFFLALSSFRAIGKLVTAKTAALGVPMPLVFFPIMVCSILMVSFFLLSSIRIIRILLAKKETINKNNN